MAGNDIFTNRLYLLSKSHHFAFLGQKTPPFGLSSFQIGLSRLPKIGLFYYILGS